MTRLASTAKMQFYPTPSRVIEMLTTSATWETYEYNTIKGILLDPCAGEGVASALAKAWDLESVGVELDECRADDARKCMDTVYTGSYAQLRSGSAFASCLFLNPPYDTLRTEGHSKRQEVQFLIDCTPHLQSGGLLIFIPPRHILERDDFLRFLYTHYSDIKVYDFPSPEVESFDQVVVFAVRDINRGYYATYSLPPLTVEGPLTGADVYAGQKDNYSYYLRGKKTFQSRLYREYPHAFHHVNPLDFAPTGWDDAVYVTDAWDRAVGYRPDFSDPPLCAPRPGHRAMMLAAGAVDGVDVGGTLLKGSSEKLETKTIEEGMDKEGEPKEIEVTRQRIVTRISTLDLITGDYESWRADEDQSRTAEWFHDHSEVISDAIRSKGEPKFKPEDIKNFDFTPFRAPGILPGMTEPTLLPLQKQGAASMVTLWRQGWKLGLLSGEQGVGKTTIGALTVGLSGTKKAVVICPSHLVRKWVRETGIIFGEKKIAMAAKKLSDVDAFFASDKCRFLVISKEMAKLGSKWEHRTTKRGVVKATQRMQRSGGCYIYESGYSQWVPYTEQEVTEYSRRVLATCPKCATPVSVTEDIKHSCPTCKEQLWQVTPLTAKGTKRFPLADYIAKRYAHKYNAIIDECHQFSGSSSQSQAVHRLLSKAKKGILMTGTIYNGRASSIFQMLYWADPRFRQMYKQNDAAAFVAHHGLFEERKDVVEETTRYGVRRGGKASQGRIKEIPGMSPAMIPMMLPYTNFIKLKDLELSLPGYQEHVRLVDHQSHIWGEVASLQEALKKILRKHPKVLGAYLQACLGYPDCPEQGEVIKDRLDDGTYGDVLATAAAYPREIQPKDQYVIDLCKEAKGEGRKSLIYCTQTTRRDARHRLAEGLREAGLRVEILDHSIPPERREEWVMERVEDIDVLITNGRLVETGLDLVFASVVIQYGIEYNLHTLRQSIRRCWRLGQTRDVDVYFLGYRGTMQEVALNLIARKMRAAEMVDGEEAGGLAQSDEGGADFLYELARSVVGA